MAIEVQGGAIAAHRCCHRRRRTCGLARGRDARPRRHRRRAGRSASGLSAGFPLREARRRTVADAAADRPRRRRAAPRRRPTGNAGWRASAASSTSCRASSSAASSTTRWSTPCARKFPNGTEFIHAKVTDIATGPERQTVKLSNGEEICRAPRRHGHRPQHRAAPEARHRARGHQRRPFGLDRLRRRAGGPRRRSRSRR